jgi:formyl-CoA transferase
MSLTGFPEGPPIRVGTQIGDIAGGVYAVLGILLALHYRDISGKGQMVDCAMFDALCHGTLLELFAGINITGKERHGNRHPVGITNIYKTSDDQHVILFILSDAEWERSLRLFGKDELLAEKWTARTRIQRRDEVDQWISEWMQQRTWIEADKEMTEARIAHHRVTGIRDLETDPQVKEREILAEDVDPEFGGVLRVRGTAPRLTATPASIGTADRVPVIGQHTEEVLSQMLDYSIDEVAKLREEGIV